MPLRGFRKEGDWRHSWLALRSRQRLQSPRRRRDRDVIHTQMRHEALLIF